MTCMEGATATVTKVIIVVMTTLGVGEYIYNCQHVKGLSAAGLQTQRSRVRIPSGSKIFKCIYGKELRETLRKQSSRVVRTCIKIDVKLMSLNYL